VVEKLVVLGGHVPNKAQFIDQLAERLDGDRKRAAAALDAVIDTVYAAIARGEKVIAGPPDSADTFALSEWPGRAEGLTQRESEVLVMMARGYTNAEIADSR